MKMGIFSIRIQAFVSADVLLKDFICAVLSFAARSRIGVANMARQRSLTVASASTVVCSSITETSSIVSPAHTVLSHSTPVSYPSHRAAAGGGTQQQIPDVRLNTPSEYQ